MRKGGILIVEDENIVALDMRMRLEALGYGVRGVVDSGPAALEVMTGPEPPELVLMDIKLKGETDGIETARAAREKVDLPIVFVSAFTDERTLERAKLASPYGYIVKPFHERELRIAIELALYKFQYELSIRRAKDFAEEASRLKGEFLSNVSHELKTPLNSVIGFTELALDRSVDEEQREYLASALSGARTLSALIDSILDFASLESGSLSAELESFSLDELLDGVVDVLAIGAHSKGIEATFRRDPALPLKLVGDPGRLKQALHNLADNAVKFTERGSVRLLAELYTGEAASRPPADFRLGPKRGTGRAASEADARGAEGPGAEGPAGEVVFPEAPPGGLLLRFAVEDTGMGMPPERIGEAFGRFTQLDGSKTRPAGGTGLGLAIVARSVELLGGGVAVWSASGKGSRFELLLPFGLPAEDGAGGGRAAAPEGRAAALPLAGIRVGILGFEGDSRGDLEELLSSLGAVPLPWRGAPGAAGPQCDCCLADERALGADEGRGASLPSPLLVAKRFGGAAKGRERGGRLLPLPIRARYLLAAFAELGIGGPERSRAWLHALGKAAQGLGRTAAPAGVSAADAGRGAAGKAGPRALGPGLESAVAGELAGGAELEGLASRLEGSLARLDFADAERVSKEYRELFVARGAESCERLAFSALLLARKGDGEGLRGVIERARRLGAAAVPRVDS